MLRMKNSCEKCKSPLKKDGEAYVCSFECTFCSSCHSDFKGVCPNCDGELVMRPKRLISPPAAGLRLIKRKIFRK